MQDMEEYRSSVATASSLTAMQRRMAQFVALRHGRLQDDNFTLRSQGTPDTCRLVAQALPVAAAPVVRRLTLRLHKYYPIMDNDNVDLAQQHLQQLVQTSPLLSQVELLGKRSETQLQYDQQQGARLPATAVISTRTLTTCTRILQGLAANPARRLVTLELTDMATHGEFASSNTSSSPPPPPQQQQTDDSVATEFQQALQALGQQSLQRLVLDGCTADFIKGVCHGLAGATCLRCLTLRLHPVVPFEPTVIHSFLASLPALESLTVDATLGARVDFMTQRRYATNTLSAVWNAIPSQIPTLTSLRLGSEITKTDNDGTRLARLLENLPNLESLHLPEATIQPTCLQGLTHLQDLEMGKITHGLDLLLLQTCPALRYLKVFQMKESDWQILWSLHNDSDTTTTSSPLVSLDVMQWMSDGRMSTIFTELRTSTTGQRLRSLTIQQGDAGPLTELAMEYFLRQPPAVYSLTELSLPASERVVSVLARLFTLSHYDNDDDDDNNTASSGSRATICNSLKLLHLEKIRTDISSLLQALASSQNACSLTSLSLHFKAFKPETRTKLGQVAHCLPLSSLFLHWDGTDGTVGLGPAEFAHCLLRNLSLVRLTVIHNGKTQPSWNLLTRLVSRRNRIRAWAATAHTDTTLVDGDHNNINRQVPEPNNDDPAALWPHVLEWLVPDQTTTFVVVRDIFWPLQRVEATRKNADKNASD